MKIFNSFIAIFLLILCLSTASFGQCETFVTTDCIKQLATFSHDKVFNTIELSEGESAELHKTVQAHKNYRIAVCCETQLPKIKFSVIDSNRNVLFSNINNNYATMWDFKPEENLHLIIAVEIETIDDKVSDEIARGCVAILIGTQKL